MEFHRNNHFVPQNYLKRWSLDGKRIWGYRLLVSNPNVPEWNTYSIRGLACREHLYTRLSPNGEETDEIERWLDREFEAPAEEAIHKATTNCRLKPDDWEKLILFTAAQFVRTPAQLEKNMKKWQIEMPGLLNTVLKNTVQKLEKSVELGKQFKSTYDYDNENLPVRVSRQPSLDQNKDLLKVETIIGRAWWLFGVKHILTKTAKVLLMHKWSIIHPTNLEWITSDDPVICLNYYKKGSYDFGGGWGRKGSEIIFPISPNHMLYTMVGKKKSPRIDFSPEISAELQKIIAEHAYRWIFSKEPNKKVESFRKRHVDNAAFRCLCHLIIMSVTS